jgi:hypothetical protein
MTMTIADGNYEGFTTKLLAAWDDHLQPALSLPLTEASLDAVTDGIFNGMLGADEAVSTFFEPTGINFRERTVATELLQNNELGAVRGAFEGVGRINMALMTGGDGVEDGLELIRRAVMTLRP